MRQFCKSAILQRWNFFDYREFENSTCFISNTLLCKTHALTKYGITIKLVHWNQAIMLLKCHIYLSSSSNFFPKLAPEKCVLGDLARVTRRDVGVQSGFLKTNVNPRTMESIAKKLNVYGRNGKKPHWFCLILLSTI